MVPRLHSDVATVLGCGGKPAWVGGVSCRRTNPHIDGSVLMLASVVLVAVAGIMTPTVVAAVLTLGGVVLQLPLSYGYLLAVSARTSALQDASPLSCHRRVSSSVEQNHCDPCTKSGPRDSCAAPVTKGTAIGAYQVPITITQLMPVIPTALGMLLFSRLPGADEARHSQMVMTSYARTLALSLVAAMVAMPLMPLLVPLLYGEAFRSSILPAEIVMAVAFSLPVPQFSKVGPAPHFEWELVSNLIWSTWSPWLRQHGHLRVGSGISGLALAYAFGRMSGFLWFLLRGTGPWGALAAASYRSPGGFGELGGRLASDFSGEQSIDAAQPWAARVGGGVTPNKKTPRVHHSLLPIARSGAWRSTQRDRRARACSRANGVPRLSVVTNPPSREGVLLFSQRMGSNTPIIPSP